MIFENTANKTEQKLEKELGRLGIKSTPDLLFYFPARYEDFSNVLRISEIRQGEQISIKAKVTQIKAVNAFYGRINRAEAIVSDQSGSLMVVWFNQSYISKYLNDGDEVFLAGTVRLYQKGKVSMLQLQNPVWEKVVHTDDSDPVSIHTGRIIPIYRLGGAISLRNMRTCVYQALQKVSSIKEYLPEEMLSDLSLLNIQETIRNLHFPENNDVFTKAKYRMGFEEVFYAQLAVIKHRAELEAEKATPIPFDQQLIQNFIQTLPWELTMDQKKAAWDILKDMQKTTPMNRLLEGDVGSGKTLVAFIAALQALSLGHQVVLLCPTEILAQQHYNSALKYFKEQYTKKKLSIMLLTGKKAGVNGNNKVNRKELISEIKHGGPQLVIATHAALQTSVEFKNITLLIIDEQHRFGVRQRAHLQQQSKEIYPHLLSMSATPIPRTLKLSLFGDLEISQIKQMPKGRKVIKTKVVNQAERPDAYTFVQKQIDLGRQIFVVTPLIEESDKLGVKSATQEHQALQKIFLKLNIGLLHGKMKATEKETVMQSFLNKEFNILVSTSVIEVGVDVPNASVMIIEGAERFGLAQLHQFRGRVGRSEHQSYCLLFSDNESERVRLRLKNFSEISDGFELAEIDLKTRGFGNIFGEEQSGFAYFKFYDYDPETAKLAQTWAKQIYTKDPGLKKHPEILKLINEKIVHLE
ncbi:MAG: ATP-dependent DNA helicase RecG [Candidatus Doudnabacteria bacterium]